MNCKSLSLQATAQTSLPSRTYAIAAAMFQLGFFNSQTAAPHKYY